MSRKDGIQNYPRTGQLLEIDALKLHGKTLTEDQLRQVVMQAMIEANRKSSRVILDMEDGITDEQMDRMFKKSGKELFAYFIKYCGDPASTAHQCHRRHYKTVAEEQFRNRTLQKERMNSGWRYQFIAKDAARLTNRFNDISDLGQVEADFNVSIEYVNRQGKLTIYISVKNRTNTMGGQDWPKAIAAMENVASRDKNRTGEYLCVFGIAMEQGGRLVKANASTKQPYSYNTEIWKSDFFWPFFTNCSYEMIMTAVLDILISTDQNKNLDLTIPVALIESFGGCCMEHNLLDEYGCFNDPHRLLQCFCGVNR